MAKVGEGDARWLVQDRVDGKNVGNWHWTEKSLFPWAKEQLETTFKGYVIFEDAKTKVWFESVDNFKGDMFVNNRKGKTLYIWDVNLYLRWKAIVRGEVDGKIDETGVAVEHEAGGKVECTDITVTDDDFDTKYTIDTGDNAQGRTLLAIVKQKAVAIVQKEFKAMTTLMAQLHSAANTAPAAGSSTSSSGASTPATSSTPKPVATSPAPSSSSSSTSSSTTTTTASGQTISVKTISQTVKFETTAQSLFETLLDTQRVSAFTGSPAQISNTKGSEFKMFGGSVTGTLDEVTANTKLVQTWRFASWPQGHSSIVTLDFQDKGNNKVLLKLTQTGVPEADFDRTRFGWEEHFWRRIKGVFGWNYKIKN